MMAVQTPTVVASTATLSTNDQKVIWIACAESPLYFTNEYVEIEDAIARRWIPFKLWSAQARTLKTFQTERLIVVLKARQIGLTWLALSYALWLMIFHPAATVLLFSKRDDEAIELLERLKGMYHRLPVWMRARAVVVDNAHEFALSNGSRAKSFPTTAGDSYTASLVIGDEFDLVTNQDKLLRSVQPAIDNGGQMILLSRPDKDRPLTRFKKTYRSAKVGLTNWVAVFLPWFVHPGRDAAWYAAKQVEILENTGSKDELFEQYPSTDAEALAARTLNKRIAPQWLTQCYQEEQTLITVGVTSYQVETTTGDDGTQQHAVTVEDQRHSVPNGAFPAIPGLKVFRLPEPGVQYVMGADTAEGLQVGDDSSLTVVNADTGEEVARLDGKYEPKAVFPALIDAVGRFYNYAPALVERNNHGHAVIGWLQDNGQIAVLEDEKDSREGWNSSTAGKVRLYDTTASIFMHGDAIVHDAGTYHQLASIEKDTLRAPEGLHDDLADSYALAQQARKLPLGPDVDFV